MMISMLFKLLLLLPLSTINVQAFLPTVKTKKWMAKGCSVLKATTDEEQPTASDLRDHHTSTFMTRRAVTQAAAGLAFGTTLLPTPVFANTKCTDIESCREIGDKKLEKEMKENPPVALDNGVRYKVLRPGTGEIEVSNGSTVDLAFSVNRGQGTYMYSRGFGYEKVDFQGRQQKDLGLDSLRMVVGKKEVPKGIEQALIGMKRGEKRRVELPAEVGFATSGWKPEPTTQRGVTALLAYKRILDGFGSQPPFPAPTIWDLEVLSIKK